MAAAMSDSNNGHEATSQGVRPPVWPFAVVIVGLALLGVAGMARPLWTSGALDLHSVRSRLVWEEGRKVLLIEGEIANPRSASVSVAPIRLSIRNRQGFDLRAWTIPAPKPFLTGGDRASFVARLPEPPQEGVETAVSLEPLAGISPMASSRALAAPRARRIASIAPRRAVGELDIPNLRKMP